MFRFQDLPAFARLMGTNAGDLELPSPAAEPLEDGEWILAVFEVGPHRRATSAAARAAVGPESTKIVLEPRDCRRLAEFARVDAPRPAFASEPSITQPPPAAPADDRPPQTERSATLTTKPPPPAATVSTIPPRGPLPSGAGARVLVVDDDDAIRDMVAAMLEAVGLTVQTASSAEDALAQLRADAFDLVVLDWNMPRMTGIELCRALRQKPGLASLPVLFLTANAGTSDMVEAFAAGADDYVVKPFRAPELGARIFSLLRRARMSTPPS
jgi:two-component system phosphate regulon response regulator PhoB